MKLGDFSSLVQLGVGIHAGTAFFSMLSEFQFQPVVERIDRVRAWLDNAPSLEEVDLLKEKLNNIKSSIKICEMQYFNEYRLWLGRNFMVAAILLCFLTYAAFDPSLEISELIALPLSLLCWYPAFWSFIRLWKRGRDALERPVSRLEKLEAKMRGDI